MTEVNDSHGVQVGSSNVMYNTWALNSPTAASLSALSVRAAVARLQPLAHDQLVDLFAAASPTDVCEIIRELLRANESLPVSILGDLKPHKAAELIQPLIPEFTWLSGLPAATESISSLATTRRWSGETRASRLKRAPQSPVGTNGFFREFDQGFAFWCETASCSVTESIADSYQSMGGSGGPLGYPLAASVSSAVSPQGTTGTSQDFEAGTLCSSIHGTFTISRQLIDYYRSAGGFRGWLGFPLANQKRRDGVDTQPFEGGTIYASKYGIFSVRHAMLEQANGWIPVSEEVDAGRSPISAESCRRQRFGALPSGTMNIYHSTGTGAHRVGRHIFDYYENKGGPRSALGLPVGDSVPNAQGGVIQMFEGGCVYYRMGSSPVSVFGATIKLLKRDEELAKRLGWPISEEQEIAASGKDRIQFFEHGIVTQVRGWPEIWLRT